MRSTFGVLLICVMIVNMRFDNSTIVNLHKRVPLPPNASHLDDWTAWKADIDDFNRNVSLLMTDFEIQYLNATYDELDEYKQNISLQLNDSALLLDLDKRQRFGTCVRYYYYLTLRIVSTIQQFHKNKPPYIRVLNLETMDADSLLDWANEVYPILVKVCDEDNQLYAGYKEWPVWNLTFCDYLVTSVKEMLSYPKWQIAIALQTEKRKVIEHHVGLTPSIHANLVILKRYLMSIRRIKITISKGRPLIVKLFLIINIESEFWFWILISSFLFIYVHNLVLIYLSLREK